MSDTNSASSFSSGGGFKAGGNISTNTILLSRKKMGLDSLQSATTTTTHPEEIKQQSITNAPVETPKVKRMTADMVWCPKCNCGFEISPEFYGVLAECSECGLEFQIPNEPIEMPKARITAPPQHAMRNRTANIGKRTSSTKKKKASNNTIYYVIIAVIVAIIIALIIKG